ncbi:MAG: aminofutalosine synthase MqnE [Planctomycetaceae bacterium]|nr:aminofutalosine synthase MqnE [Planctomycetaceae bacterium]
MRAQALARLAEIEEKTLDGETVSLDDGLFLFDEQVDLVAVAMIADRLREQWYGRNVYYNVNMHINPTNVCKLRCPLCAFSCDPDAKKAYLMSDAGILERASLAAERQASEIHIVGGIHPEKRYEWYRHILEIIHHAFPALQLKAWTAVEIAHFSEETGMSVSEVLQDLVSVGLSGLPGGGAEIFDPQIRRVIAPAKPPANIWLEVHQTAHSLGLSTNATMLFGHVEKPEHRISHLLRLRELQAESIRENRPGRFEAFVPLLFHASGTKLPDVPSLSTFEQLRTVAISRILLNNVPHLKAYWVSLGLNVAKMALRFGADDFDGTVHEERIHHDAGSNAPVGLDVIQLRQLILDAGYVPVERDSHYQQVKNVIR